MPRLEAFLPALAAKVATETIPILFVVPDVPIKVGLVNSIARPTGNVTGVNFLGAEIGSKRLELLRDCRRRPIRIAAPSPNKPLGEAQKRNVLAAAQAMGLSVQIFNASTDRDIDAAFAALVRERPDAPSVMPDPASVSAGRVQLYDLPVTLCASRDLLAARVRRGRRADELRI